MEPRVEAQPRVFWSSPSLPGETALLGTTSHADVAQVQAVNGSWVTAKVLGASAGGLGVVLPASFPAGSYAVRVRASDSSTWSTPHELNAPNPWFLFGDEGAVATPAGFVRAVGVNLHNPAFSSLPTLTLKSGTTALNLSATADNSLTRWHARFELPADIMPGEYEASISNGARGGSSVPLCTFVNEKLPCLSTLTVVVPKAWPTQTFTVVASQPGYGRNATSAIHAALARAAAAGGGVVYLPRGQYFVTGPIVLPEKTVLRGESRGLVSVYFAENNASTAPDAARCRHSNQGFCLLCMLVHPTIRRRASPGPCSADSASCAIV